MQKLIFTTADILSPTPLPHSRKPAPCITGFPPPLISKVLPPPPPRISLKPALSCRLYLISKSPPPALLTPWHIPLESSFTPHQAQCRRLCLHVHPSAPSRGCRSCSRYHPVDFGPHMLLVDPPLDPSGILSAAARPKRWDVSRQAKGREFDSTKVELFTLFT
jgi:hypothetical protein